MSEPYSDPISEPVWVATDVPTFAVVGKVNMGKSAVLATLLEEDDDARIRISPEPGETTRCQRLSLVLNDEERLRFIDTPGFQQPVEALRAIRSLADPSRGPGPETLKRFVAQYRNSDEFIDECRLLEPLLEGAGVLYVVDPDVPVTDAFIAEIEILRLSAGARLAVLNPHHRHPAGGADYGSAWRSQLGQAFNLVRTFDAHQASFAARRELLAALNQIDERDRRHLDTTLALLDEEWAQRREDAATRIQTFMQAALTFREHVDYGEGGAPEAARRTAAQAASRRYYLHLSQLERSACNDLLDIYRHHKTRAQADAILADDLDLSSEDTWQRLGLTRRQLAGVAAALGGAAGLSLDVITLGHTLGLGGLIGSVGSGALAYFKGDALPTVTFRFGMASLGGDKRVTVGPPNSANFAWVLFDSLLIRYRQIVTRTHARRGDGRLEEAARSQTDEPASAIAREMPGARQKLLARWFRDAAADKASDESRVQARIAIQDTLAEIEAGSDAVDAPL